MIYDLIIRDAFVVDAKNNFEDHYDIGIENGKIAEISNRVTAKARNFLNLDGKLVIPGVVDAHVHISSLLGGAEGHRMMAKAGVTTAVDYAGPVESVIEYMLDAGAGLNISCLESVRPEYNLPVDASKKVVENVLREALEKGAVGIKIMGGHYPLTPETTAHVIECCNQKKVAIAFHSGSLATGSNLKGFIETVELSNGLRVYVPHINGYCRGLVKAPQTELAEALEMLEENPNLISSSHLARINGTSADCKNGKPISEVTNNCLRSGGYDTTQTGMRQAIMDGYAKISCKEDGEVKLISGHEGVDYWESQETKATVSFPVNLPDGAITCATAKNTSGDFIIDVLSTDGGGIPRNISIPKALLLVKIGALSMKEMVQKMCFVPAQIYGFSKKGFLEPDADADITVIDYDRGVPYMTIVNGKINMVDGTVLGNKGTFYATEQAKLEKHVPMDISNISEGFYKEAYV